MVNNQNIITSEDVAPRKTPPAKQNTKKKITSVNTTDRVLIYFESGYGYLTKDGIKFSSTNRIAEVSAEEANALLKLPNFRLPSDEEKKLYYNIQEG